MAQFVVQVGVALSRPPRTQEFRKIIVGAENGYEAELIACQIAQCTSVMATESLVLDWDDDKLAQ